jgi:hypothetical protein
MSAGRKRLADPGSLYTFAHQFYWDFRRIAEGGHRWVQDKVKLQEFEKERKSLNIPKEAAEKAEEEIQAGLLPASRRQERRRKLEHQLASVLPLWPLIAQEETMKQVKIPGEPEIIEELLNRKISSARVRELCRDAVMKRVIEVEPGIKKEVDFPAWPIPAGSTFPTYLSQFAEQHVSALNDPRYPRCDVSVRPSNQLKQFWFLSRALAGALFGVKTRTAINLVGSLRPEELFEESRAAKPTRKRIRRKYKIRKKN